MKTTLVFAALLLVGCATVKQSFAPDGRKAYTLNCSGTARGWDKCLSAAGELCQTAGYDILERSSEATGSALASGTHMNFNLAVANTTERSMLISCKK